MNPEEMDIDGSSGAEAPDQDEFAQYTTPSDDGLIEIGEDKVTLDELKGGYLRQKDYTQKTQKISADEKEIAELKAQAQMFQYYSHLAESDPDSLIAELEKKGGRPGKQFASNVDEDVLTENEKALYQQNKELRKVLDKTVSQLEQVSQATLITRQQQECMRAAADIEAEFGQRIQPYELMALCQKSGIDDPLAAWKVENFGKASKAKEPATNKPNLAQSTKSKGVIPTSVWVDQKWPEAKIAAALANGYEFERLKTKA